MKFRQHLIGKKLFWIRVLTFIFITACQKKDTSKNLSRESKTLIDTIFEQDFPTPLSYEEYMEMNPNYCASFHYEITNLYPTQNKLTIITEDTLFLDNALKAQEFKTKNSGWGNWQNGPRILSVELDNGECNCEISKKYWCLGDSCLLLKITEEIKCN